MDKEDVVWGFPGGAVVENLPANAGGPGSIPGQRTRSCVHAATKSPNATTKRSHMPQRRSRMLQLRPSAA